MSLSGRSLATRIAPTSAMPPDPPISRPSSWQQARHTEGIRVVHGLVAIDHCRIECDRPEVLANALDQIALHVVIGFRRIDRPLRIHSDNHHFRIHGLEIHPRAVIVPPVPTPARNTPDLSAGLVPDLGAPWCAHGRGGLPGFEYWVRPIGIGISSVSRSATE